MTQVELTDDEARLIGVARAIRKFDNQILVSDEEVGEVLGAIDSVTDLGAIEKNYTSEQLKVFLYGFVAGFGAVKLPQILAEVGQIRDYTEEETHFTGGPSGGVAEGQGTDSRFVKQSGVHDTKDV